MGNRALRHAKRAKNDEFYTQLTDIEQECRHYPGYFKGKVIFCNCDDPYESAFFQYFAQGFNHLGLKKLMASCYTGSPIANTQLSLFDDERPENKTTKSPHKIEITEVTGESAGDPKGLALVEYLLRNQKNTLTRLRGDGDFRSPECIELLKQADMVVTNPPFSLFREYVAQLIEYDKKFLIIGNINAITYKGIFPLVKHNKMWLGPSIQSGDRKFGVPDHYPLHAAGCGIDEHGYQCIRVKGVRWFTNLDHKKRAEALPLHKKYTPEEYPRYDNYDAINVDKVVEIPMDYDGVMGVPVTFLDKYNPEQFEIIDGNAIRTNEKVPFKEHGLIKDRDGTINGKPVYVRIAIKKKR